MDSKILCPFVSVHMRFLSVPRAVNASVFGNICLVRSYPLTSFGHVQNIERTPPDKDSLGGWGGGWGDPHKLKIFLKKVKRNEVFSFMVR